MTASKDKLLQQPINVYWSVRRCCLCGLHSSRPYPSLALYLIDVAFHAVIHSPWHYIFRFPLPDSLPVETKGELVSSGAAPGCAVSEGLRDSLHLVLCRNQR